MSLKKSYQIAKFIETNNPTRKEILTHLFVNINKAYSSTEEFDYTKHRGHYSTNFSTWKYLGNVEVVNGRYKLTKQCKKNDYKLYCLPLKVKLKNAIKRYELFYDLYQKERYENMKLNKQINTLNDTINDLNNQLDKSHSRQHELETSNRALSIMCDNSSNNVFESIGDSNNNQEIRVQKSVKDLNINLTIKLS